MDPLRFLTAPAYAALVQASNNIYLPLGNVEVNVNSDDNRKVVMFPQSVMQSYLE